MPIYQNNVPFERQYIGARYVPKFYNGSHGAEWEDNAQYEPLTIVTYLANSYCSKKFVPALAGNPTITPDYWVCISNFNAQVEILQESIDSVAEEIGTLANLTTEEKRDIVRAINELVTRDTQIENKIGDLTELETTNKHDLVVAINDAYNSGGSADTKIGNLNNLTTEAKNNLVSAINEVDNNTDILSTSVGALNNLTTEAKNNLVSAINEVDTRIGTLNNLTTEAKNNLVSAINEVDSNANSVDTKVGNLNDLTTTDKTNIVAAINNITSIIPTNDYITPEKFGALGNDTNDDYNAIMDAIAECTTSHKPLYFANKTYKIGTAIEIQNVSFDIYSDMYATIHYAGNGAGVKIISANNRTIMIHVLGGYTTNTDSSCIEINSATSCNFYVSGGYGKYGLNLSATRGEGIQFNNFYIDNFMNCIDGIRLNATTGWINDNLFIGGRMTKFNSQFPSNMTGIHFENNRDFNNNVFLKTSVEGCTKGIWIERSGKNKFEAIRLEGCPTSIQLDSEAVTNYIEIGYRDSETGTPIDNGRFNTIIEGYTQLKNDYLLFESGDPRKCTYYNPNGKCEPLPYMVGLTNDAESSNIINGGASGDDYIWFNNDIKYFKFKTTNVDGLKLKFYVDVYNDTYYKFCIMFKDANGNILHNVNGYPDLTEGVINTNTMFSRTGTVGTPITVYVPTGAVLMYVGAYSLQSNNLCKMRIFTDVEHRTITPIQNGAIGLDAIPTKTNFAYAGDYCYNIDYTNNANIKGWLFDGTSWNEDYLYNPNT